jgi:MFS family permease
MQESRPDDLENAPLIAVTTPWYKSLTRYQFFVFIVCCLAWDMDCLDQQLFILARRPAMMDLVEKIHSDDPRIDVRLAEMTQQAEESGKPPPTHETAAASLRNGEIAEASSLATSIFMLGWAIGGIAFGILGDRAGRVKTLMLTILLYAIFTGLSALSHSTTDFYLYRFLTGLGVGGVFAAAVTLLAETMPDRVRPFALGLFQASSVMGNCAAAFVSIGFGRAVFEGAFQNQEIAGIPVTPWRLMFLVGVIPGFLVFLIQARLKEPEKWLADRAAGGKRKGSYVDLLGEPRWRTNAIFGLVLALSGVIGLWGIGFFSPDLQRYVMFPTFLKEAQDQGLGPAAAGAYVNWQNTYWSGMTSLLQNIGAFFGIFVFSIVTYYLGRRPTFAIFFVLAGAMTAFMFWNLKTWTDILWMPPLMGFFQLALFGGYAIYFPELFPTRLRSTGTSFCYNVGRMISAIGPAMLGYLTSTVYRAYEHPLPLRYAGITMCSVFLIGLVALPFLPETKGKPLPE